jgi:hypothetical protein
MMATMSARSKQRQGNKLLIFLPLATAFAIIAGIAIYGVLSPSKAKPNPHAPGFRGSLVWGDGIFANKAQLKAWLKLHGASYDAWVKQHPAALRLVKPVKHRVAVSHKKVTKRAPVKKVAVPAPVATATSSSSHEGFVIWLAVAAGLLFGGLAALPHGVIRRTGFLTTVGERELRIGALGAGAAVLLGVIVATLAS